MNPERLYPNSNLWDVLNTINIEHKYICFDIFAVNM